MLQIAHAITNLDRSFAEADEAYHQMLQLTPAELRKRDILSVTYHADRAQNGASLHRLIDYGTPFWIRKRYVRADGALVWVLNHVGRIVGITGATRIVAASFILPPRIMDTDGSGSDWKGMAEQTEMLKKLL